jgi:hypothetical protein
MISRQGADFWIEPLRALLNEVWERNLPTEGGDLLELSNFVARVGLNLSLNSRKVLWDWAKPYSLLAERTVFPDWWSMRKQNRNQRIVRIICRRENFCNC